MQDAVVGVTELAVGAACVVIGVGAWRRRFRTIGALATLAGAAAISHAAWATLT